MGLKDVVVQRLQQYFGDYVDGLTPENLRVQVLAGTITQSDLSLKTEALAQLQLPVVVRAGRLRRFHVVVPWSRITSEPVVVHIAGVTVFAALAEEDAINAAAAGHLASVQLANLVRKKIEAINAAETLRKAGLETRTEGVEDSYAARLGRTILNNLRVNISDVHIRFEDVPPTGRGHPVCLGVRLAELRIVTTDANGEELFVDDGETHESSREAPPMRHKALTVSRLAVYLMQPAENDIFLSRFKERNVSQVGDAFENLPVFEPHGRDYILQPSSGRVDVALGAAPWQPHATVRSQLQGISFALSSTQYEDFTIILRRLAETTVRTESNRNLARPYFRGYRPTEGALPRAWWSYLIAAHRDTRLYTSLYTKILLGNAQLSTVDLTEMRILELRLEVWQIMRCRAAAEASAGIETRTEEEYLNSDAMCAPSLSSSVLSPDYCSVDVELTITGMSVALSLTSSSGSSSGGERSEDKPTRRKRRLNVQDLERDDLVQLKLDSTYSLRVFPKDGVKEYKASIDSLTVIDKRVATAGVYNRIFAPMAGHQYSKMDESTAGSVNNDKLERFYTTVSRHPNTETVGMLAAATAQTEEEVADWFAAKNAEHLATIHLFVRPAEYDINVKIDSPFSVVYSPSLLQALNKIFAASAPIAMVDEAAARLRKTREAMSAAIAVANVSWKLKASIAPFLFLLPQDVEEAASMVLAVDLGSFSMQASRNCTQEMIAYPVLERQLGDAWNDVRVTDTSTFDCHAQINVTDTQMFLSTKAVSDWQDVLKTRTVDSRRLVSPVSVTLLIDGCLDQRTFVAALECTSGIHLSTTPDQLDRLFQLQQSLLMASHVPPASSSAVGEVAIMEQPLASPEPITALGAAVCPHVSWRLVHGENLEPVVTSSMERLVLCLAALPVEGQCRGLFRINSIAMQSDQSDLIHSGCVDDIDQDLVHISYRAGIGVSEPAEMDVKLQQLILTWHPEVINEIQALYGAKSSTKYCSTNQAVTSGVDKPISRSNAMQRDLHIAADLTVLRFDFAIGNAVNYCATVSGARVSAEIRIDSSIEFQGEVQALQIEDYAVISKWRRFVGVADGRNDSLIEFTFNTESDQSRLDVVVQSPMQFIYNPGLAQVFLDYISVNLIASAQQLMQTLTDANKRGRPQTSTKRAVALTLCAPNVVYALSSNSTKSISFDLCDIRIEHFRSEDGTEPVTTVRMVEPNATIRGHFFSDFCGIGAETVSVQCDVQMLTLNACADEVLVNGLASATMSMLNQRRGDWQVLCSVPSTVVNVERECGAWRLSCEAASKEHISVNICDSFLKTLQQSFANVEEAGCMIKNQSGVAILFAVSSSEQRVDHGAQCPLLTPRVAKERGSVAVPSLSIRPAFESDYDVPPVTLPLIETNEFIRDFTTDKGGKIPVRVVVELVDGAVHVTCRSLIEVENTGAVAVDVHVATRGKLVLVGTAVQDEQRVSVVKSNESVELRLSLQGGVRTSSPFVVGGVSTGSQTIVLPGENGRAPQFFQVDVSRFGASFLVCISAAFYVENLLPFDASFSIIDGSSKVVSSRQELVRAWSGGRADLYGCSPHSCSTFLLNIVPAEGSGYIGGAVMLNKREADSAEDAALVSDARFVHADGSVLTLLVSWSSDRSVDVYTNFWLHNLAGLRLRAREDAQSENVQPTVRKSDGRWVISGDEGEGRFGSVCGIELSRETKELFLSVESSERAVVSMEELAEYNFCLREVVQARRDSLWDDLPIPDRFWNIHCIVDMAPYPFQRTKLLTVRPSVAISNSTGETLLFSTRDDVDPLKVESVSFDRVVPVHQFSAQYYSVRVAAEDCEVGDPSAWSEPVLLDDDRHVIVHRPDSSPWFQITIVSGRTEAAKVLECKKIAADPARNMSLDATAEQPTPSAIKEYNTCLSLQISIPGMDVFFADFDRVDDADPFSLRDECLELHITQTTLIGALTSTTVEWTLSLESLKLLDVQRDLALFISQNNLARQNQTFLSSKLVLVRNAALTNIQCLAVNLNGQSKLVLDDVAIMATVMLAKRLVNHFREEILLSGVEVMRLLRTPLSRTDETKTIFVQVLQLSEHRLSIEFARTSNLAPKRFGGLKQGFQANLTLLLKEAALYEILGTADSIQNRLVQTYRDSLRRQIFGQIFRIVSSNVNLGEALLVGKAVARIGGSTSKGLRNMGFVSDDLPTNAAIVSKHFRRFHECHSIADFERQLWHIVYDWDSNHTTVNACKCVCIGILNKSAAKIRVLDVQLQSGLSCEVLRREVQPKSSTTDAWQIGSSTVLFASGGSSMGLHKVVDSAGSIECNVQTTAGTFRFTHMGASFLPVRGKTATFLQQDIHTWYSRHLIAVADVEETTHHEHTPTTAYGTVWENQRRIAVFGLGGEWSAESLGVIPGDPQPFSDATGQVHYSGTVDHRLLPRGSQWVPGSEWVPGRWQHSIGFQEVLGGWSDMEGMTDSVRRRCWTRLYALPATEAFSGAAAASVRSSTASSTEAQGPSRRTPSPKHVATLATTLRSASRATLVFIDNQTANPLQLVHMDVVQGTWADSPPEWIQPNEKVVFGLQSTGWGGCEVQVKFLCGSTEVALSWGNPFGPTFEGNWSREQVEGSEFQVKREGPTSGNNNRVMYTLLPAAARRA